MDESSGLLILKCHFPLNSKDFQRSPLLTFSEEKSNFLTPAVPVHSIQKFRPGGQLGEHFSTSNIFVIGNVEIEGCAVPKLTGAGAPDRSKSGSYGFTNLNL
jgi:hypothetical protein